MRKPDTNEQSVQMTDVLCDFCTREWTDQVPMIEGHQGSCLCGRCLTLAYAAVVLDGAGTAPAEYQCPMCLEERGDREALDRADEPGWQSPLFEVSLCRRCIELAAGSLEKDKDFNWQKPEKNDVEA